MYHAPRPSPIEAVRYLLDLGCRLPYWAVQVNSLEHDIAVIYCIFVHADDILYRSREMLMLNCLHNQYLSNEYRHRNNVDEE